MSDRLDQFLNVRTLVGMQIRDFEDATEKFWANPDQDTLTQYYFEAETLAKISKRLHLMLEEEIWKDGSVKDRFRR